MDERAIDEHSTLTGSLAGQGSELDVAVRLQMSEGLWVLSIEYEDGVAFRSESEVDAEELLVELRKQLDAAGRRLHCNRFRKNALISGMSRGMSDGLRCYLVKPWMPMVLTQDVVSSLDPAPARHVTSEQEAEAYIRRWIRRANAIPFPRSAVVWLLEKLASARSPRGQHF